MKHSELYRPDIDGLRAIAVFSVLLFHLDFTLFSGGFIGVDIFFVISGFLITRLILTEIQNTGHFSFSRFYLRRFMRLLPAAFVTLIATLIAGYFLLSPNELERLGLIATSATFSVSNFSFWLESGYFDIESSLKPLLHTWTLSIEEQFYLIWPISLLILTRKKPKAQLLPLMFLLIASFLSLFAAELMISKSPQTAFFLLPFRIYEFAIGSALVWFINKDQLSTKFHEVLVLMGLAMIIGSFFIIDEKSRFPGLISLLPCIGTGLIIFSGKKTKVSSVILSCKPLVFTGLISYSLYLVHWPLIVFFKKIYGEALNLPSQILLIVISFILAICMYKFIETPFRRSDGVLKLFNLKQKFIIFTAIAIFIASLSLVIWKKNGFPERFNELDMSEIINQVSNAKKKRSNYLTVLDRREAAETSDKKILIVGDSYADDIAISLADNYTENTFLRHTRNGCRPFINYTDAKWSESKVSACRKYTKSIIEVLETDKSISHIVINTRWDFESLDAYKKTLDVFSGFGKPIIVIGPRNRLSTVGSQLYFNVDTLSEYRIKINEASRLDFAAKLHDEVHKQEGIYYIDFREFQCIDSCSNLTGEVSPKIIIYDTAHFTVEGSRYVGSLLAKSHATLFK